MESNDQKDQGERKGDFAGKEDERGEDPRRVPVTEVGLKLDDPRAEIEISSSFVHFHGWRPLSQPG